MRSGMARDTKDLSYVVVFLCQEHQLRGICLRSLVIVNSLLGAHCALKCRNNTKTYTSAQTCVIFCWLKKTIITVFFFSFFFISMVAEKGLTCCKTAVQVPELSYALYVSVCVCVSVCVPLACPLWMMALLKCCEKKHWFSTPLIHCWCERNLHSRQTRGRSGLSLAGWLDTSSLSSGLCFGSSHSALAHNLQEGLAEGKTKNNKGLEQIRQCSVWKPLTYLVVWW